MTRKSRTRNQHTLSSKRRRQKMATAQSESRQPLGVTASFEGGERGIRTPGPGYPGHSISSAAQSATLSSLRSIYRCIILSRDPFMSLS